MVRITFRLDKPPTISKLQQRVNPTRPQSSHLQSVQLGIKHTLERRQPAHRNMCVQGNRFDRQAANKPLQQPAIKDAPPRPTPRVVRIPARINGGPATLTPLPHRLRLRKLITQT